MTVGRPATAKAAGPLSYPAFRRFWVASTISGFGSYVTLIAIQVLVVETLHGSASDVGLVNGARWLPYLLVGLVAGVVIERHRRRPVLVVSDLARAVLLAAIPLLAYLDDLTVPVLAAFMVLFGGLSLGGDAAAQSFLPRTVPPAFTTQANARLAQSDAAAQTVGPAVGGALITALSAPVAVLVDAASYLFSGVALLSVRVDEPIHRVERRFRQELAEGLRWVYRHRMLAPLALSTHGWFLFSSMFTTAFTPFALREVGVSPLGLGLVLAATGVGGLLGSSAATSLGMRWGAGRVIIASRALCAVSFAVVALAASGGAGAVALGVGQFLFGVSLGTEDANELGYRQAVTPDRLQGRMNATMRSLNRAMVVVGAPLGGVLADSFGYRPTMWLAGAGILVGSVGLACTPFRTARHGDPITTSG